MDSVNQLLSNPYIVAALLGVAVYYGVETYKPGFLQGYDWATPMNLGLAAALFYVGYQWYSGSLRLPMVGGGPTLPPSVARAGMGARVKYPSRSVSDLLGPDQF